MQLPPQNTCSVVHIECPNFNTTFLQQSQQLVPFFNTAIEFIHGALKKGGRVLVHCAMGQSRCLATSPPFRATPAPRSRDAFTLCFCRGAAIVIAYIMATKQLGAAQATE